MASAEPIGNPGYNPSALSQVSGFVHIPTHPDGADDGRVPGFHHVETERNAFGLMIYYHRYRLTNRAVYIDPDADLPLQNLKGKVELLYPTVKNFLLLFLSDVSRSWLLPSM